MGDGPWGSGHGRREGSETGHGVVAWPQGSWGSCGARVGTWDGAWPWGAAVGRGLGRSRGAGGHQQSHATSPQLRGRRHPPVAGERLRAAAVARLPRLPGGQLRGDARAHGGPVHGEWGAGRGGGWRGSGTGAEVDCAVPRARASPGSSSSSPTGASRSGRRSARSRTGEPAAAPLAMQRFIQQDPLWPHPTGTDRVTPWHPPTRRCLSVRPSFHCHVYPYPESEASRVDTMNGLHSQIQDLSVVSWAPRQRTGWGGGGGHGRTPLPSP